MKKLLHPVTITFVVVALIISLPFFMKKKTPVLTDAQLRERALSTTFKPVPKTYEGLLKAVDNPDNPLGKEKIALGKVLFNDIILSDDRTVSCASCHVLKDGGDDNLPTAIGVHGQPNPHHLNSPTVLNAALAKAQFWDGRAKDVEEQAGGPIQAPFEMHMTPQEVESRLNSHPEYRAKFKQVFHEDNITFEQVRKAIGAYERTLLTRGAYDRFLEGDDTAISAQAKRGMTLFLTKGCKGCHSGMSVGGQSMQKFPLRRYVSEYIGLWFEPDIRLRKSPFPFINEGGFLGKDGEQKFRVPILRNITRTSPYFHNGAVEKIEEVVRIMSKYQVGNEFTPKQIDDVVAFLKTLEGEPVAYDIK
ncbi:cytochrome-c peroxidase [Sulfurovum sp. NBC37-1]|uniref:cytochrome-c peroxidase n=1 Tax=Sulfurovum sp. (strain NBC37-1) TaxID=387093 RepID=UPI00015875DC|nr:cytochrome c peroxidase [Sulfurovum sp. NBC37-1]BAF71230.1 cytochrome c peroxidase [Sulfurovum sp. NBC37-1]